MPRYLLENHARHQFTQEGSTLQEAKEKLCLRLGDDPADPETGVNSLKLVEREICIRVTAAQENFLKQFIQTDTLGTNRPIFVVQNRDNGEMPWSNVAYFFSLEEARRYKEYQKHNLKNTRIYAECPGYSNNGDWEPFYDLLTSIGRTLLEVK